MIITDTNISPLILEKYNRCLLSAPIPKLQEDEEDILSILNYLQEAKWHKLDKCPRKKSECEQLYKQILEIYESIKKKKEDPETEKDNETQRFMYFLTVSTRSRADILFRLKQKARRSVKSGSNNKIQ